MSSMCWNYFGYRGYVSSEKNKCRRQPIFAPSLPSLSWVKREAILQAAVPLKPLLPGTLVGGGGPAEAKFRSLGGACRSMRRGRLPSAGLRWSCRVERLWRSKRMC